MRVGVLTTSYPRFSGDSAGLFVEGFSRWLARSCDVEVLCADDARPLFYRGGAPLALRGPAAWSSAARFSGALAAAAWRRRKSWDAVVSHWLVPSAVCALPLAIPHLAIAHGSDVALLRRLPGGESLIRCIAARSDLVYVARSLIVPGAPGRVVAMGVDEEMPADRLVARTRLGCADRTVLLYLGRLIHDKGIDLAVAARPAGALLVIAGEGPAQRALRRSESSDVRFVGVVSGALKRDWLAAADVVVVPSRRDASPVVVSEAFVAGTPVVATRTGGLPDLIRDGVDGILCEPNSASLTDALGRVCADPDLLTRLKKGALHSGHARTWDVVGPQLWEPFIARSGKMGRPGANPPRLRVCRC